jgi:two-component system response regulator RegA
MSPRSILLVDDDEPFRERMARALRTRGFEVFATGDHASAVQMAAVHQPDFAIVDLRLPDTNGHEVARDIIPLSPETKLVMLTGYGSIVSAVEAMQQGVHQYLTKPLDADELVAALHRLDGGGSPDDISLDNTPSLARAEWEHIQRVLADTDGNISETARRLGIARRTLQLKLKKYPPRM